MGELFCPMCAKARPQPRALDTLILDLITFRGLSEDAQSVLEALWQGGGLPVHVEEIFDKMYEDDPDGGPSTAIMYRSLRVALSELYKVLADTGLIVIDVGKGCGYRIGMMEGAYVQ